MADAPEKLAASYAQLAADAERIRINSAEHMWVVRGVVLPKLPDDKPPAGEQNPRAALMVSRSGKNDMPQNEIHIVRHDEFEITPAMISAGFEVLSFRYDPDASGKDRREVVRDMYLAIIAARPSSNGD
jgi:hypothetical protein